MNNSPRHLSRVVAMQSIFASFHREKNDMSQTVSYMSSELPHPLKDISFAEEIACGAINNADEIEKIIAGFSSDGSISKIDPLTLSVLYVAVYELKFSKDPQPFAVVINEAIELAKEYGKDSSAPLVNGILSRLK